MITVPAMHPCPELHIDADVPELRLIAHALTLIHQQGGNESTVHPTRTHAGGRPGVLRRRQGVRKSHVRRHQSSLVSHVLSRP